MENTQYSNVTENMHKNQYQEQHLSMTRETCFSWIMEKTQSKPFINVNDPHYGSVVIRFEPLIVYTLSETPDDPRYDRSLKLHYMVNGCGSTLYAPIMMP